MAEAFSKVEMSCELVCFWPLALCMRWSPTLYLAMFHIPFKVCVRVHTKLHYVGALSIIGRWQSWFSRIFCLLYLLQIFCRFFVAIFSIPCSAIHSCSSVCIVFMSYSQGRLKVSINFQTLFSHCVPEIATVL